MKKQRNQNVMRIAIMTPYLTEYIGNIKPFDDDWGFSHNGFNLEAQKKLYGYNPDNLIQCNSLETNNGKKLILYKPNWRNGTERDYCDKEIIAMNPLLVIEGSTRNGEIETNKLKGSKIVVARYSIFYGRSSQYTGNSPEATGYSLDIPKDVDAVKTLLKEDSFIEALIERNPKKIIQSLDNLKDKLVSKNISPIVATSYLENLLN